MTPLLPIDAVLPDLLSAFERSNTVVLVAPPGAGKTTKVPLALLQAPWRKDRKIILLEPRRLAARAAAQRMADLLGEPVGRTVGLRMRMGSKISAQTRIEVVTEGVFARMIVSDPELTQVACVLFDEFHERSLDADLGLALTLESQSALREDLKIGVMSATLDDARIAQHLNHAPVIASEGRSFPVSTVYLGRDPRQRLDEAVTRAVLNALSHDDGSILVFLPGMSEIRRVQTLLEERLSNRDILIAPLYGALTREEQDKAIAPPQAGTRKIVLATSIAETSLTIEGVRIVVDSGLTRAPVFEPDVGLTRLETIRASRASSDQRRGRAGRTEPGVCYRLWEEAAQGALIPFTKPEILSADLSSLVLSCAAWGVSDPCSLPFLDPPPEPAFKEAQALLRSLDALDEDGQLTSKGKLLDSLPLPPRMASMLVEVAAWGQTEEAALLALLLTERGLGGDSIDLSERLERLRRDRSPRAMEAKRMAQGWAALVPHKKERASQPRKDTLSLGALLAFAYPDRIAKSRKLGSGDTIMASGRAASLPATEPLAKAPYLTIADLSGTASNTRIMMAASLSEEEVSRQKGIQQSEEVSFDPQAKAVKARRVRRLGRIVLSEQTLPAPCDEHSALILAQGLISLPLNTWPWHEETRAWRDRVTFLRCREGEAWPDVGDEVLKAHVETWLAPHLLGLTGFNDLSPSLLLQALESLLPYDLKRRLDAEAPTVFKAPTGTSVPIDYGHPEGPKIAVRVQELFGLTQHPQAAGTALVIELLSPARRPIQITRDLPGFWKGSWASVRAEMRGRYPKHPWPDDPAQALATTRTKKATGR